MFQPKGFGRSNQSCHSEIVEDRKFLFFFFYLSLSLSLSSFSFPLLPTRWGSFLVLIIEFDVEFSSQAILTGNHFSNTKYVLNAMNLHHSPTPPGKDLNREIKLKMNKAKTNYEMGEIFGLERGEVEDLQERGTREGLEGMVPRWRKRRRRILEKEGKGEKNTAAEEKEIVVEAKEVETGSK